MTLDPFSGLIIFVFGLLTIYLFVNIAYNRIRRQKTKTNLKGQYYEGSHRNRFFKRLTHFPRSGPWAVLDAFGIVIFLKGNHQAVQRHVIVDKYVSQSRQTHQKNRHPLAPAELLFFFLHIFPFPARNLRDSYRRFLLNI